MDICVVSLQLKMGCALFVVADMALNMANKSTETPPKPSRLPMVDHIVLNILGD
jgi:hypothetical protein